MSAHPGGEIRLGSGLWLSGIIMGSGVLGIFPYASWVMTLFEVLDVEHNATPLTDGFTRAFVALAALSIPIAPWVVPMLVLRARQRLGARITWDGHEVIEWDGPDRRTVISWSAAVVAQREWRSLPSRPWLAYAVQIVDPARSVAITVWSEPPDDAPYIRRRLVSEDAKTLRDSIAARGVMFTSAFDWSLASDRGRAYPAKSVWRLRLGYLLAGAVPLVMSKSAPAAFALASVGAVLLALRAAPVFGELRVLRTTLIPWEQRRLRAVRAEALIRGAFPLLVIATACAAWKTR